MSVEQTGAVTVQSDDVSLNVLVAGDPDAPPIVFLHGGGLTAWTWRHVIAELQTEYRCVAPDLRGHGDSGWSASGHYSLATHADDLTRLLEALDVQDPHLVGMSLGGQVVLRALCDGVRARSAVLVDVGPRLVPRKSYAVREFLATHRYPDFDSALDAAARFQPTRSRDSLRNGLTHAMTRAEDGSWSWKWDPRRRAGYAERAGEARALWPHLEKVSCSTLVVRGSHSPVFTADLAEEFVAALPNGRLETLDAGHNVHSERPTELVALIRSFHTRSTQSGAETAPP